MRMLEILQELPTCDPETQSKRMPLENGASRLAGQQESHTPSVRKTTTATTPPPYL